MGTEVEKLPARRRELIGGPMDGDRRTSSRLALYFGREHSNLVHEYLLDFDKDAYVWAGMTDRTPTQVVFALNIGQKS